MKISLELAKQEEAEEIYKLQQEAFYEQLQMYQNYDERNPALEGVKWVLFKIHNHEYYKIIVDGTIVGQIDVYKHKDSDYHYEMNGIFVHPSYQNLGLGTKALSFIENKYKDALIWTLWTPNKTYKNHHFYEKAGYRKTGQEDLYHSTA